MKKKNLNRKLNLSKKTISNFQSLKITGAGGHGEPVRVIGAEPTEGGCACPTEGGAPSCGPCRDASFQPYVCLTDGPHICLSIGLQCD